LGFLRSYVKMGKFSITFYSGISSNDSTICNLGGDDVLLRMMNCSIFEIDCSWKSQTSQTVPVMIQIPKGSSRMVIEVLNNSSPTISNGSGGNKVKITSFVFFTNKETTCALEPWLGPAIHNSTYTLETEKPDAFSMALDVDWVQSDQFAGPWIAISSFCFLVSAAILRISRFGLINMRL
jgi:hypothetical protein